MPFIMRSHAHLSGAHDHLVAHGPALVHRTHELADQRHLFQHLNNSNVSNVKYYKHQIHLNNSNISNIKYYSKHFSIGACHECADQRHLHPPISTFQACQGVRRFFKQLKRKNESDLFKHERPNVRMALLTMRPKPS